MYGTLWVKAHSTNPEDFSLILKNHMAQEEKGKLSVLSICTMARAGIHEHTYTGNCKTKKKNIDSTMCMNRKLTRYSQKVINAGDVIHCFGKNMYIMFPCALIHFHGVFDHLTLRS